MTNLFVIKDHRLLSYINGEDIDNDELEKLEDDSDFMLKILTITKDKNTYMRCCSENLKNNYQFIKNVIMLFRDDKDFIISIANQYLFDKESKLSEIDKEKFELNILMTNILQNQEEMYNYRFSAGIHYCSAISKINLAKDRELDSNYTDYNDYFMYIEQLYEKHPIIIDYFASRFINTIFSRMTYEDIEDRLHSKFKTKSELNDQKKEELILSIINDQDELLCDYISKHLYLLDELKKYIDKFQEEWDSYYERKMTKKIDMFYNEVDNYSDLHEKEINPFFNKYECIKSAIKETGLTEIFKKYDLSWSAKEENNFSLGIINDGAIIDGNHNDEVKKYKSINESYDEIALGFIKKLAKKIFITGEYKEQDLYCDKSCVKNAEIITLRRKK